MWAAFPQYNREGRYFMNKRILTGLTIALSVSFLTLTNCSKAQDSASTIDDSSASGSAAGAIGGALSGSSSSGTQAQMRFDLKPTMMASLQSQLNPLPNAFAADLCPRYFSSTGCSASGSDMWLSYSNCTFTGRVEWSGVQALSMSSGAASCGTFPNPGANGTLYRQYVQSSGSSVPGQVNLTYANKTAYIDDASSNLANFDGDSIAAIENGGYGVAVGFNAQGKRSQVTVGHHIVVNGGFDHSISGTVSVVEGSGSRTINGSVQVYHNLMKVIGTSTFNNVIHDDTCCLPVGGSITTVFSAGANVAPVDSSIVGKSETLTFTGCGSASLQQTNGQVINVTLNRCF